METQVKPNLVQYIQSTQWLGENNLSIKTLIKKYIEGGVKWANKEMKLLNLGNTKSGDLLDVKVQIGMDLLSQFNNQSECGYQSVTCSSFSMNTNSGNGVQNVQGMYQQIQSNNPNFGNNYIQQSYNNSNPNTLPYNGN